VDVDEGSHHAVVHALLSALARDREHGIARSLAEYQARFPGHEALVERELDALLADGAAQQPAPEQRAGPYALRRELGRGGQAVVWLAHDPRLQRDVALKVLPRHAASLAQELRLQREASTAARLDDSAICPVYEVGHDDEHLYLAMRFVPGRTLAAQLDAARARVAAGEPLAAVLPPVADTLQFFERLAQSLHRAHAAGVVHRDLKPANVMVGLDGLPVLLDFGLAITTDDDAPLTRTGDVFGTPHYLSPERLTDPAHRGDARDDLWALAVTLYEALTLQRPFTAPTLEQLYRAILQREPARASALRPELPRDLDAVLAVALDKAPVRRYRTAADLADDLRAVRCRENIRARPPGLATRIARWHRRHRALAAAGWIALAGLASTVTVQQLALADVRAAQTETGDLNQFLVEKLLLAVTPDQARGENLTVAQVFDLAAKNVDASFPKPSRTSGTLHHVLGQANARLGRQREARAAFERAAAIRAEVLGDDDRATLATRSELVEALRQTDDAAAAEALLADVLARQLRVLGPDDRDTLATRLHEVRLAMSQRRLDDAERLARAALADHERVLGADAPPSIESKQLLARTLDLRGQRAAAEPLMRDVVARRLRTGGEDSPAHLRALTDLTVLLQDAIEFDGANERFAEVEQLYGSLLARTERLHGKRSQAYATALNGFASLLQARGRRDGDDATRRRAVAAFRESLALREAIDGAESTRVANALGNLGSALVDLRKHAEAIAVTARSLALRDRLQGREHGDAVRVAFNLMMIHARAGDAGSALAARDELVDRLARSSAVDAKSRLFYGSGVLEVLYRAGRHDDVLAEGEPLWQRCVDAWPPDGGPTGRGVANRIAKSLDALGRPEPAARWRARVPATAAK
jgi:hypothetical protein